MALLDIRQRAGYLFVAITLGHIVLISAQVRSAAGVPVLVTATFGVFAEVQRATGAIVGGVRHLWRGYVNLAGVGAENERLRLLLADRELQLQQQRAQVERSRNLERLLEFRDRTTLTTVAAEIIAAGASPEFRTLTLDKGTQDGLQRDMAVIAPAGVVGRIVVVSARAAKVQLLIDRNAAAGAIVERSRAQGLVVGTGDGRLHLNYLPELSDVVVGDVVGTSGIDGIYPKGFTIGRVEAIERASGTYRDIVVTPGVDFANLEEVLVVVAPTPSREAEASP